MAKQKATQKHDLAQMSSSNVAFTQPEYPRDSIDDLVTEIYAGGGVAAVVAWHTNEMALAENEIKAEAFRQIAAALWTRGDANIRLAAWSFLAGLSYTDGKSEAQVAKELKCTRAAISKEKIIWKDKLAAMGFVSAPIGKSESSRDTFSRRRKAH